MKGLPVAVVKQGTNLQIWVSSPTGDSSDSFRFDIPCLSETQAQEIAQEWTRLMEVGGHWATLSKM